MSQGVRLHHSYGMIWNVIIVKRFLCLCKIEKNNHAPFQDLFALIMAIISAKSLFM